MNKESVEIAQPKGRGFGNYVKGERVTDIATLHTGALLLHYSTQFDSNNTVIVSKELDQRVYVHFVNPDDWTERQGEDFCIWDHDLSTDEVYRAISADVPHDGVYLEHDVSLHGERSEAGTEGLSSLPRPISADVSDAQSAYTRTTSQNELSELCQHLSETGEDREETVRDMREREVPDASSGLQRAAGDSVAVPSMSFTTSPDSITPIRLSGEADDEDGYEDDMESWNPDESGDEDEPDEDENPKPEPVTTSHTFVVDVKEFRAALELSVADRKTTIPVLSTVCLVPQGSSLQVLSTDLDKWTVTQVPAMIDDGAGNVLLPHRKTLELLKGETGILRITAKVTTQGDRFSHVWVRLEVGGCEYDVPGMNPINFPQVPEIPAVGFDVSGSDLKASLGRIMVAISTEESRYTINGALFECNRRKLLLVGTDGHRLALDSVPLREVRKGKALIHRDALAWVAKYSAGDVVITLGEEMSFFHVAQTVFITRNLKGNFPNYKAVTPRMDAMTMTTTFQSGDELAKTLGKVARMADERSGAVKWAINGTCVLSAESYETGKASATVKASIVHSDEMPEIVTGFNSTYVLDALKVAGKNPVVLSLRDNQSAGVFTVPSLPEYSYTIMPMRI